MQEPQSTSNEQDAAAVPDRALTWLAALREEHVDTPCVASSRQTGDIVRTMGMDPALVLTAELVPFLREGHISLTAIEKRAGRTIAQCCRDLMQLFELSLPGQWMPGEQLPPAQGEALRRMLLAVVNDYRLVVLRLAALLADLRQARDASAEQQRTLARDTREIFAPLANRLGIWQLKWELEDFAFRYLQPDDYKTIARQLAERREEREQYIGDVSEELAKLMDEAGIEAQINGRPKHIYSIWKKMRRKQVEIDALFDVRAVRIMVNTVTDCYTALGVVHNRWPYIREEFDDYIANPKGNNYQSLHTAVFGPQGHPLEIQIRTYDMHRQAELGVAAHWRYKEGGPANSAFEQKISWLRQLLDSDEGGAHDTDMLENISEGVFDDRVYAITPRGDIIDLPAGATPLDFAYQVHTQIGHRCKGARANGRIVTLTYTIRNGDRIEIITRKEPQPSRDWLAPRAGFLASASNRTKVRSWFRQQDRDLNRKQGRELLERELQRLNAAELSVASLADKMNFTSFDDLCVAVGVGDTTPAAVANAARQLLVPAEAPVVRSRAVRKRKPSGGGAVLVEGSGSVMTQFARCCNPVPPQPISGYITQGRGITVHLSDCSGLQRLAATSPDRILQVSWRDGDEAHYAVTLRIEAADRNGLLKDISGVLSDESIRILGNASRVNPKNLRAIVTLNVEVDSMTTISRAVSKLGQIPGIEKVSRSS